MIETVAALLIVLPVGIAIGSRISRPKRQAVAKDDVCTGYQGLNYPHAIQKDCRSNRSPTCLDGRCTYHCANMCKCDASNDPEHIGRRR